MCRLWLIDIAKGRNKKSVPEMCIRDRIIAVQGLLKSIIAIVAAKARHADLPLCQSPVQELPAAQLQKEVQPLEAQAVDEIDIDFIGLEPLQLLVQEAVQVGGLFDHKDGQLGGDGHLVPHISEGLRYGGFIESAGVGISGIEMCIRDRIYSTHPRSRKRIESQGFRFHPLVQSLPPFGFLAYNKLQMNSFCVLSDSGTLSEESALLGFVGVLRC